MANNFSFFEELPKEGKRASVWVGDGHQKKGEGVGNNSCTSKWDNSERKIKITNVLYVPGLMCNLLSVSRLRRAHFKIVVDTDEKGGGTCRVMSPGGKIVLKGYESL